MLNLLRQSIADLIAPPAPPKPAPGTPSTPGNPNPLGQPTIKISKGGYIACTEAQPDFDQVVLLAFGNGNAGLGMRTREIDSQSHQEKWKVVALGNPGGGIVAWKAI